MAASSRSKRALAFVVTVIAATVLAAIVIPWYAKKRLLEEAAAHGIALQVDEVSVGLGKARATKVSATFDALPGVKLTAPDMTIDLDGFTPKTLALHGPVVEGAGPLADARDSMAKAPPPPSPLRLEITYGTVRWQRAYGEANLELNDVTGHVIVGGSDEDLKADVNVTLRTLAFGTYKVSYKHSGPTTTMRVAAPVGPAFAELGIGEGTRDLTVNVPKTKAADLGIPSAALGLVAEDGTMGELHVDHHEKAGATEGHVTFSADKIYLGHTPAPTAIAVDVRYAGKGDRWPVTGGSIQAGPFRGDVSGTVERTPTTILAHLESTSQAMSCAEAIKSATAQAVGSDVAGTASAFAQLFGMDKAVTGDVKLIAKIDADLANLGKTSVAFRTEGACVLSFLPATPTK